MQSKQLLIPTTLIWPHPLLQSALSPQKGEGRRAASMYFCNYKLSNKYFNINIKPTLNFLNNQYMKNYSNYNIVRGGTSHNNKCSEKYHIVKTRVRKVRHFCDILRSENVYCQLLNIKLFFCKNVIFYPNPSTQIKYLTIWNLNNGI